MKLKQPMKQPQKPSIPLIKLYDMLIEMAIKVQEKKISPAVANAFANVSGKAIDIAWFGLEVEKAKKSNLLPKDVPIIELCSSPPPSSQEKDNPKS